MECLNSDHRKEWWMETVKKRSRAFSCQVETASWEHVSKIKASQNKNKIWWSTLDSFLDPKQTPDTLGKNQNQNKKPHQKNKNKNPSNSKSYSKSFDETWQGSSDKVRVFHFFTLEYAENHLICDQGLLPSLSFENNKPWGGLRSHIFSQWNTLQRKKGRSPGFKISQLFWDHSRVQIFKDLVMVLPQPVTKHHKTAHYSQERKDTARSFSRMKGSNSSWKRKEKHLIEQKEKIYLSRSHLSSFRIHSAAPVSGEGLMDMNRLRG